MHVQMKREPIVVAIVSTRSNMGKTTLIEGLVQCFKAKNYAVGVLKHDAHRFEIDKKGKDSYRFSQAGADNVVIASSEKIAMVQQLQKEKSPQEIMTLFQHMDLVFVEGFRESGYPKIEVHRREVDPHLLYNSSTHNQSSFVAVASNERLSVGIPVLDINNIPSIAEFIETNLMKKVA